MLSLKTAKFLVNQIALHASIFVTVYCCYCIAKIDFNVLYTMNGRCLHWQWHNTEMSTSRTLYDLPMAEDFHFPGVCTHFGFKTLFLHTFVISCIAFIFVGWLYLHSSFNIQCYIQHLLIMQPVLFEFCSFQTHIFSLLTWVFANDCLLIANL